MCEGSWHLPGLPFRAYPLVRWLERKDLVGSVVELPAQFLVLYSSVLAQHLVFRKLTLSLMCVTRVSNLGRDPACSMEVQAMV